jgi:hypothetical protein
MAKMHVISPYAFAQEACRVPSRKPKQFAHSSSDTLAILPHQQRNGALLRENK